MFYTIGVTMKRRQEEGSAERFFDILYIKLPGYFQHNEGSNCNKLQSGRYQGLNRVDTGYFRAAQPACDIIFFRRASHQREETILKYVLIEGISILKLKLGYIPLFDIDAQQEFTVASFGSFNAHAQNGRLVTGQRSIYILKRMRPPITSRRISHQSILRDFAHAYVGEQRDCVVFVYFEIT